MWGGGQLGVCVGGGVGLVLYCGLVLGLVVGLRLQRHSTHTCTRIHTHTHLHVLIAHVGTAAYAHFDALPNESAFRGLFQAWICPKSSR